MGKLFMPFTPNGKATENRAIEVKKRLDLGPYASVDPYQVVEMEKIEARIVPSEYYKHLPPQLQEVLLVTIRDEWSAFASGPSLVDGKELIFLNPNDQRTRQKVSLMEEIIHILLGHPKDTLHFDGKNGWKRPFDKQVEDEAFNVGAACIIPYRWLFEKVSVQRKGLSYIAAHYRVSEEYVGYRIKRAGLHNVFRSRQRGR